MAGVIDDGAFDRANTGALRVGVIANTLGTANCIDLEVWRSGADSLVRTERQTRPAVSTARDDAERHDDADSGGGTDQSRFGFEPATIPPFAVNRQQRIDDRLHGMLAVGLDTRVLQGAPRLEANPGTEQHRAITQSFDGAGEDGRGVATSGWTAAIIVVDAALRDQTHAGGGNIENQEFASMTEMCVDGLSIVAAHRHPQDFRCDGRRASDR